MTTDAHVQTGPNSITTAILAFGRIWPRKKRAVSRPAALSKPLRIEQLEDRTLLTLLGQSLFPADNPWNQNISQAAGRVELHGHHQCDYQREWQQWPSAP